MPTKCLGDSRVDCSWVVRPSCGGIGPSIHPPTYPSTHPHHPQYSLNYGGGLVAGDNVRITCEVGAGCTAVLTTQGSTKVYKMLPRSGSSSAVATPPTTTNAPTSQHFNATVAASATLALLPDPFTCFR